MAIEFDDDELNLMGGNTLSDSVYDILRGKILDLSILPGTVLNIKELGETLGISRSPIRDAFSRLGTDGLVDIVPQKETKVSLIDVESVPEERFLRYVVERGVMEECIGECTDEYFVKMNECIANQEEAWKQKDVFKQMAYDNEYHKLFFQLADKMRCWAMIMQSTNNYERIRQMALWFDDISANACEQHRNIARYVYLGKRNQAMAELDKHLNKILYEKQQIVQKYPEYFLHKKIRPVEKLSMLDTLKRNMNLL
ncbi:MAG: GntR family transcriptional regulator [Eubacteriales bacterium]|nr:GntR family transcriptional regulator [Eubacteriales bacterium]